MSSTAVASHINLLIIEPSRRASRAAATLSCVVAVLGGLGLYFKPSWLPHKAAIAALVVGGVGTLGFGWRGLRALPMINADQTIELTILLRLREAHDDLLEHEETIVQGFTRLRLQLNARNIQYLPPDPYSAVSSQVKGLTALAKEGGFDATEQHYIDEELIPRIEQLSAKIEALLAAIDNTNLLLSTGPIKHLSPKRIAWANSVVTDAGRWRARLTQLSGKEAGIPQSNPIPLVHHLNQTAALEAILHLRESRAAAAGLQLKLDDQRQSLGDDYTIAADQPTASQVAFTRQFAADSKRTRLQRTASIARLNTLTEEQRVLHELIQSWDAIGPHTDTLKMLEARLAGHPDLARELATRNRWITESFWMSATYHERYKALTTGNN